MLRMCCCELMDAESGSRVFRSGQLVRDEDAYGDKILVGVES
jgi:hypothetical protein